MSSEVLFFILTIVLIGTSIILQYFVSRKFFKKNLDNLNKWIEGRFFLALFLPKVYFSKEKFWRGYLLYILSALLLILGFVAFYIWLTIKGGHK
ncbi:hypothetical protein J4429_03030 [Candidatus Pacearchaeota archaeon]|nr:hypothetical protein [Candidatus Pacearchaeota archaeon]